MADRSSRSATRRMTPQSPPNSLKNRNKVSQSPPRWAMRSTRSRSIESERSRVGLKRGQNKGGQAERIGADTDNNDLQHARQGNGRAQSKPLQDLATVVEDMSFSDTELPQDEVHEADQTAGRGKALPKLPKRFPGARSSGAISAFSGNMGRTSESAPSWEDLGTAEEVRQGTSKKIVQNEPLLSANGAQTRPVFRALSGPLDTTLQQINIPQHPTPKPGWLGNSNTSFNSPKIIQGTAGYLKRIKANREASEKFQKPPQQSSESVQNVSVEVSANSSVRDSTPVQRSIKPAIPLSAPGKLQMELPAEIGGKVLERSKTPTNVRREYSPQSQIDWQHPDFEDSIAMPAEAREGLDAMARRVEETKARLEADNNKENLAAPGPARQPQHRKNRSPSAQGGKKKHFIDPQPNAQKLKFDDSQDSQQQTQPSRKRQRDDLEAVLDNEDNQTDAIEVSSDEGFQQDRRATGAVSNTTRTEAQNRVVREPLVHRRLRPKKARSTPRHDGLDDESRGAVTLHDQGKPSEASQFENYQKANEMAKRNVAVLPKKVQTRKTWTDEETETLISLIGDHGISWKLLKEQDNVHGSKLKNRDQVALKDKARNMKFDYLKAGPFLPQNFEGVPLNKTQMDKLRSLGIVYDPTTGQRDDGEEEAIDTDEPS